MHIRLWFATQDNPVPRVIAHGTGPSLRAGMVACFAPVSQPGWVYEEREGRAYCRRGNHAVYLGEDVNDDPRGDLCALVPLVGGSSKKKRHRVRVVLDTSGDGQGGAGSDGPPVSRRRRRRRYLML